MYKIRGTIFTQTFQFDLASLDRNQYIKVAVLYINFYLVGIESSNLHSMEHNICNILGTFVWSNMCIQTECIIYLL